MLPTFKGEVFWCARLIFCKCFVSPDQKQKYSIREDGYWGLKNIWEQGGEGKTVSQVALRPVAVHLNSLLTAAPSSIFRTT